MDRSPLLALFNCDWSVQAFMRPQLYPTLSIAIRAVLVLPVTLPIAITRGLLFALPVLHVTVSILRTPTAIPVAPVTPLVVPITVTALFAAWSGTSGPSAAWRALAACLACLARLTRSAGLAAGARATSVKAPASGRRGASPLWLVSIAAEVSIRFRSYLDLEDIVTTDTHVMHLVVRVISIATALVLDEREAAFVVSIYSSGRAGNCVY